MCLIFDLWTITHITFDIHHRIDYFCYRLRTVGAQITFETYISSLTVYLSTYAYISQINVWASEIKHRPCHSFFLLEKINNIIAG